MNIKKTHLRALAGAFSAVVVTCTAGMAQTATSAISVNTSVVGDKISDTQWGVFFEDINFGADGGLYAELIKNRSFEFAKPLMGWKILGKQFGEGDVLVLNRQSANTNNPRFVRISLKNAQQKRNAGLSNEGFKGMGIKKNETYNFSVMYRQSVPGVKIHIELTDSTNRVLAETHVNTEKQNGDWNTAKASFKANESAENARFNIWFEGEGQIDLDMISLFPKDTWKGRPGGMRKDMVQMLADLKPGFIRFPGGCIVEGIDLANRYQWKKTIGPLEERQLIMNRWNVEFAHRPAPDYFQTFGLGFFEYFQLAEDIGAAALPILNCGMACQYNTAELVPIDQLDPYIQDALDLIEFANGDVNSHWGKVRADLGHPEKFDLRFLGVGNENWGPQYIERAKLFQQAIKSKYPSIKLIFSSGTDPDSERFHYLDSALRGMNADIIDEHYYRSPEWFLKNANRYDNFSRTGSKIFAGEYAAHLDGKITGAKRNNWQAALAEAAFMTGLERNAAVVEMASYAPLFANEDGWQWAPDLIWVNSLNVYATPNYYVQKLFSTNKGTETLHINLPDEELGGQHGVYSSAVIDRVKKQVIVKVVNTTANSVKKPLLLAGKQKLSKTIEHTILGGSLELINTFEQPNAVVPKVQTETLKEGKLNLVLAPYSLNIYKVNLR
ncbi:alpha-L-arabinofuranosidase C-terminal domain-containing protein [Pedobacter sp. AW1-32]|uniref:alpha-L-arabinofuranosidase C-terminal domain-containing protein n=1 Tax=Pedobacter sp. AW1-32 TaxID=3383026 RepID=UPI003FED85FD